MFAGRSHNKLKKDQQKYENINEGEECHIYKRHYICSNTTFALYSRLYVYTHYMPEILHTPYTRGLSHIHCKQVVPFTYTM